MNSNLLPSAILPYLMATLLVAAQFSTISGPVSSSSNTFGSASSGSAITSLVEHDGGCEMKGLVSTLASGGESTLWSSCAADDVRFPACCVKGLGLRDDGFWARLLFVVLAEFSLLCCSSLGLVAQIAFFLFG